MPGFKTHCAISKKRTGCSFSELHRWIDEPYKKLGKNHRTERHYLNDKDMRAIKNYWDKKKGKGWGQKAIVEWLFHIALDNLDTAFKFSKQSWSYGENAYNFMEFGLNRSGYIHCNFGKIDEHHLTEIFEEDHEEEEGLLKSIFKSIFG